MDALLMRLGGRPRFLRIPPFAPISAIRHARILARVACSSSLFPPATGLRPCPAASSNLPHAASRSRTSTAPEPRPTRRIELTARGESVEDFYRTGTQADMEEALGDWLRAQIQKIEQERGLRPKQGAA